MTSNSWAHSTLTMKLMEERMCHFMLLVLRFEDCLMPKQYRESVGIHVCGIVYHICGIVYHICGIFDPQMWYSIPHMWYTQIFFFDFDNFSKNFPMGILKKFFWILIVRIISEFWA